MIRRRERVRDRAPRWEIAAEILAVPEYEQRLNAVIERVRELIDAPNAYLYLPDPGARHLHLERMTGPPPVPPETTSTEPVSRPQERQEGGAAWSVPAPPLELALGEQELEDHLVHTVVGALHSIALRDRAGALVGVVQTGPAGGPLRGEVSIALESIRAPLAFALERARTEEALRARLAEATAGLEAHRRLASSAVDLDRFTGLLLDMALKSTRTEAGFVAIQSRAGGALEVRVQAGMPEGFAEQIDLSLEGGLFDWTPAADGGALVLADFEAAERLGITSLLAVPLIEGSEPLGIFALVNFGDGGTFDENSLEMSAAFADQIRLMLHNERVFRDFAGRYLETVKGIARALDARRAATHGHHERVSELAASLARALDCGEDDVRALATAGLIHDVGLAAFAGIEGTFDVDIEHPTLGASLVEHLPLHPQLAPAVATHHEWYDGWGFPRGLAGESIPLAGRILAVAEFVAEMTTESPVRAAWPADRVTAEILHRRGTQFDPRVADAAVELLARAPLGS
jgi:HD-GYP domain-containing protein (c-di-GMP phosphodiesterase class II)